MDAYVVVESGRGVWAIAIFAGLGLDERFKMSDSASGSTGSIVTDIQGSTVEITKAQAQAIAYSYPPFGGPADYNPFRYTGREVSINTGLYYYRGRYYNPTSGRFVSEDPIGFTGGVNIYAYVLNDPLNSIDPLGWQCQLSGSALVAAAQANATHVRSTGNCVGAVRQDFAEAGGGNGTGFIPHLGAGGTPTFDTIGNALLASGCYVVAAAGYSGTPADVEVTEGSGTGHVSIDVGSGWAADYVSRYANPGGPNYGRSVTQIYRFIGQP